MSVSVNYLAVVVAAIIPMVLGFLWYGPLFGKQWMKLVNVKKEDIDAKKSDMPKLYGIMFVTALIMSYVLARFIVISDAHTLFEGLKIGFWVWLGFIATVKLADVLFNGNPIKLYYLDAAYRLLSLLLMGALLGVWR